MQYLTLTPTPTHASDFFMKFNLGVWASMKLFNSKNDVDVLVKENLSLKRKLKTSETLLNEKKEELQQYLYAVSHELKTPIISMRGYSLLLQDFHLESLNEEIKDYLERIIKNLDQMDQLVDDLLDFTRINVKAEECEQVEVGELVNEALKELNFLINKSKVTIDSCKKFPVIFCHRNLMLRVFTNLLSNALKYSKNIKNPKIEINYFDDEFFHKFYIKDNGIGMTHADHQKIFQIFGRLNNKKGAKGSGLGLVIAKRIIEKHGGEIWVESAKGRGSTFYLTIPRLKTFNRDVLII